MKQNGGSYLRQGNSQRKAFRHCNNHNGDLMGSIISEEITKEKENSERKILNIVHNKNLKNALTAIVNILMTPSTMPLALVLPRTNWTLPSGFFVYPVKYL